MRFSLLGCAIALLISTSVHAGGPVVIPPGKVKVDVASVSDFQVKKAKNLRWKVRVTKSDGTTFEYELTAEEVEELKLEDGESVLVEIELLSQLSIGGGSIGSVPDGGTSSPSDGGIILPPPPDGGAIPLGDAGTPVGGVGARPPAVFPPARFSGEYLGSSFIRMQLPKALGGELVTLALSGTLDGAFEGAEFPDATRAAIPPSYRPRLKLTSPSFKLLGGQAESGPVRISLDPEVPITGTINFVDRTYDAWVPLVLDMPNFRVLDPETGAAGPLRIVEHVRGVIRLNPAEPPPERPQPPQSVCGHCGAGGGLALPGFGLLTLWALARRRRSRRG